MDERSALIQRVAASSMSMTTPRATTLCCCRCARSALTADQLLPVPFCARHYVCRSCLLSGAAAGTSLVQCPGCSLSPAAGASAVAAAGLMLHDAQYRAGAQSAAASPGSLQTASAAVAWHPASRSLVRLNGSIDPAATAATTLQTTPDTNGNGQTAAGGSAGITTDSCSVCRQPVSATDQWFYCQSCTDVEWRSRSVCQSCWQQHQLDAHLLPRLRADASSTAQQATSDSLRCSPAADRQLMMSSKLLTASDEQRRPVHAPAAGSAAGVESSSALLRPVRPRLMRSQHSLQEDESLSSLLGGLVLQTDAQSSAALTAPAAASGSSLLTAGLQDATSRQRRLVALQAPISRQYEAWLWQALNNAGFDQAARNIDDRRQQISVHVQTTLRDMEFRLERSRAVLDEFYRESMRQLIDVARCQMEALQVQSDSLQRVRLAATRLQHARLYNDKARALVAETELASALRRNATSSCLRPCDDGYSEFHAASEDELRVYLRSTGGVDCHAHAPHCSVQTVDRELNCLSWTLVGRLSEFDVQLRNHCHAAVDDYALTVLISDSHGAELSHECQRRATGQYVVRYRPTLTGTHHIYVLLRDRHLADSPYTVGVTEPMCYRLTDCPTPWTLRPVATLSYNLVKPWGVCCCPASPADDPATASQQLLVADRDAHSIIVFDRNGSFVGRRASNFRRPTHLAVTSRGHVVVTDKDNHRIQVFTAAAWSHVRTFGSEGDRDGQFRYPWEVAVNSVDEILVSDSKNYRVQLFSESGVFVAKHCLERASRDDKDGPRGVAFSPSDFAAVADFDMLRVLILSPDLRSVVHVIGVASAVPRSLADLRLKGCIERPRGVAFDSAGNLLVVQARTNRDTNSLLRFTRTGDCNVFQFERDACGLCVCADGRLAIVQPQTGVVIYAADSSA